MNKDYHYIFFCHVKDRVLNRQSYLKIWDPEHVVLRGVYTTIQFSVVDPDPYDLYVYGPPGSRSVMIFTDPDPSIIKQKYYEKP
jgi:hypothetical protein